MTEQPTSPAKRNCDGQPSLAPATGYAANVHFSSATPEWSTPQEFFDRLNALHDFTLDPCSTHENAKCARHYTAVENGLAHSWQNERVWMNPPYGREIGVWMKKAYEESLGSALVVCLVPARTDTAWFHSFVTKASQVQFLKGRLKFGGHANSAPFPSMLVVFGNALDATQGNVELLTPVQQISRDSSPSVSGCGKFTESNSDFSLFEFGKKEGL
jgi:site-specific DNA-methyltransferase (adenine-specific)